ncbi:MAG: type II secretion system F family protein [Nitrospiraceae bacterium]|nr:MAG: type II secretion system F family protein [Nitrospiraceae bacterium]
METFHYEASTKDGSIVSGTLEVASERAAVDRIQDMGYFPLKIKKTAAGSNTIGDFITSLTSRVVDKDIMTFTYQLGVLLDAGFPLERSLSILADLTEKKKFGDVIGDLVSQIRSGKSFSESLAKFPAVFPVFYVNMIKSGEAGGFLEDTISRMATYLENAQALKEDVRSALVYPMVLSIAGGLAIIILLTFVVPKFTKIFSDMGEALPLPTIILLNISNALTNYWWVFILVLAVAALGISKYIHSDSGKQYWDRTRFKLPIFGKLYREATVSRFARTLGTLLASGVPILNALQIVRGTLGSESISKVVASVREAARKGRGISEPLRGSDIFPPIAVHMVTVGEETGRLDEMLVKIADRFDIEIRTTVKRMLSLLEPALILIMGIVVGFIVIAMLMAIFSINELPF